MKVAHWCWIIPEPGSGPWVEPPLPSCLCQESSVLQNTTVVDLSLVCNDDRWYISYISILPRSVPDGCKPRLLAFASRWKRRPSGIGALISSAAPHRTRLDSFSFIRKSGVLNDWRLKSQMFLLLHHPDLQNICLSSRKDCPKQPFMLMMGWEFDFICSDLHGLLICTHSSLIIFTNAHHANAAAALW